MFARSLRQLSVRTQLIAPALRNPTGSTYFTTNHLPYLPSLLSNFSRSHRFLMSAENTPASESKNGARSLEDLNFDNAILKRLPVGTSSLLPLAVFTLSHGTPFLPSHFSFSLRPCHQELHTSGEKRDILTGGAHSLAKTKVCALPRCVHSVSVRERACVLLFVSSFDCSQTCVRAWCA